jgi:predicted permease
MLEILIVIAPLFIIIFTSAILQRAKKVGEDWSAVLNDFALNVGLPALIISALAKMTFSFSEQAGLIIANSAFLIGGFIISYIVGKILKLKKKTFSTLFICLSFGNIAYLGIPTLTQIFGQSILPTTTIIVAIYLFWIFTIGISFLDYQQEKRKKNVVKKVMLNLVKNPLLIAIVVGIIIAGLKIEVPDIIMKAVDMVAASVTPVVLVVIGLFIGKSKIGKLREWIPIIGFSVITLMVLPALFYMAIKLLGYETSQFSSSIIEAAMPLAITPFALADEYGLNKKFIARSIVLSTTLSIISIPFWTSIL